MKACVLTGPDTLPGVKEVKTPQPGQHEILIEVQACALCRTDLHVIDGDLPQAKYPLILGHEIVGRVKACGRSVKGFDVGQQVGVPWLASTCRQCRYCLSGKENLCDQARFTGYTFDGGFAQYTVADSRYAFVIPDNYDAVHAAPLLCAGLIGWRCLRFTEDSQRVGIYGFGAAAHIVTPLALNAGKEIFAFTSPGDSRRQDFASRLGASWAGDSTELPPEPLDAAIIFAPRGDLLLQALKAVRKGGIVVCGGIHMSDIPSFPYSLLWGERTVKSVANLTRADGEEFFSLAARLHIQTEVVTYDLQQLPQAIADLRSGRCYGAAVMVP